MEDIAEHLYLKVEVKAGRRRVTVRHTLQSHIVSFHQRFLSSDLELDVLCGVCAENTRSEVRERVCVRVEGVLSGPCAPNS